MFFSWVYGRETKEKRDRGLGSFRVREREREREWDCWSVIVMGCVGRFQSTYRLSMLCREVSYEAIVCVQAS
jgi:hypothetical protein